MNGKHKAVRLSRHERQHQDDLRTAAVIAAMWAAYHDLEARWATETAAQTDTEGSTRRFFANLCGTSHTRPTQTKDQS